MPALQIDRIRQIWMKGDFDSAVKESKKLSDNTIRMRLELLLIYLFAGNDENFYSIIQQIIPNDNQWENEVEFAYNLIRLHEKYIRNQFDEKYDQYFQSCKTNFEEIPTSEYSYFWKAIFKILHALQFVILDVDYDKAIAIHKQSLEIVQPYFGTYYSPNYVKIAVYNNLGEIYRFCDELDKSLEYLLKAKKIALDTNLNFLLAEIFSQIGTTYFHRGEIDKAIENYQESLEVPYLVNIPWYQNLYTFRLFHLYYSSDLMASARRIFEEFKEDANSKDTPDKINAFPLMGALMKMKRYRVKFHHEAQESLKSLVSQDIYFEYKSIALLYLMELLLKELSSYENPIIITEIQDYLTELQVIAKKRGSEGLYLETKIIRAKLAMIDHNIENAYEILEQIQKEAIELDLFMLSDKIKSEIQHLTQELDKWQDFSTIEPTIQQRIQRTQIEDYIEEIVRRYQQ